MRVLTMIQLDLHACLCDAVINFEQVSREKVERPSSPLILPCAFFPFSQDIVISALPQGETGAINGESLFGPTVRNSEATFSLRLLRRAFVA